MLKIGKIVNYVLAEGPSSGKVRPAIVVEIWSESNDPDMGEYHGSCQLQVFTDSDPEAKYNDCLPPLWWRTSVNYDSEKKLGTFHFADD